VGLELLCLETKMGKDIPDLYDQSTYFGRLRHFSTLTNPLTLFASTASLERAKELGGRIQNLICLPSQ
jgi:hypothetical protein